MFRRAVFLPAILSMNLQAIALDKHCEELAFSHLLSADQYGYQVERVVKLSPTRYFN